MAFLLIISLIILPVHVTELQAEERSLHTVLQKVESETGFRMLYRDALVTGKTAEFSMNENWRVQLILILNREGLEAVIDEDRKQIVIFRSVAADIGNQKLTGYVIDRVTGEHLPFATVSWSKRNGESKGTQTDLNGRFRISHGLTDSVTLKVSYIGYHTSEVVIGSGENSMKHEIGIRLQPSSVEISEIVVAGSASGSVADSIYRGLMNVGNFSPLGESNTIRILQTHPAVSPGASIMDGSTVRGSSPDAMHVLLDGAVIYNHSHLFGLIDSFNPDIIRTGGFYYDIAPARFQAPPGGVLNLVTKTGSLHDFGGTLGISNSMMRTSIEGPFQSGKSSWLFAARHSIINHVNLFDTAEMVSWGLDIDRESSISESTTLLTDRIVTPGDFNVRFYDLHGKIFLEDTHRGRWTLSGYIGGDVTTQISNRIVRTNINEPSRRFENRDFETGNQWGNRSAGFSYYSPVRNDYFVYVQGGFSYYYTGFVKEDFVYQRPGLPQGEQLLYVDLFENESELKHGYFSAEIDFGKVVFGGSINLYDAVYLEQSLNRSEFFQKSTPIMPEIYFDYHIGTNDLYSLSSGIRFHYYSDGKFLNLSPRVRLKILPDRPVSIGVGYSRNFQYIYRLSINNLTTSDIWITALEGQTPARSDNLTAGVYISPWKHANFQTEAYLKWQGNLRYHEINIQNLEIPFQNRPWFSDNEGYSRGIELMFRQDIGKINVTQSYTWSVSELRNSRLNNGEWFFTELDRRHIFGTTITYRVEDGLIVSLNRIQSSGRPDKLTLFRDQPSRLGRYSRYDLSINYTISGERQSLNIQAGVYNLSNRKNPWYREWVQTIDNTGIRTRLVPVKAEVYDLNIQPSFSVTYQF